MSNTLKLYYWDYDMDGGIASDKPEQTTLTDALQYMEELSETDGNFLGFELADGKIIQFMHDENLGLLLDIPDIEEGGSYTKTLDLDACLQIIRDLYNGKKPMDIEGLSFDSY